MLELTGMPLKNPLRIAFDNASAVAQFDVTIKNVCTNNWLGEVVCCNCRFDDVVDVLHVGALVHVKFTGTTPQVPDGCDAQNALI